MEIKPLQYEEVEIEIRELYIDEEGNRSERVKKVKVPSGKLISPNNDSK